MIGIYFKVTSEENKANLSNVVHNYLFDTLDAIKFDKKTRFFITYANVSIQKIMSDLKLITNNDIEAYVFEVGAWSAFLKKSLLDKLD